MREAAVHLHERLEHHVEHLGRDAAPRVAHVEARDTLRRLAAHRDAPFVVGELDRVREQVAEYLLQALAVGAHAHAARARLVVVHEPLRRDLRRDERFERGQRAVEAHRHELQLDATGLDAREAEHVVHE